MLVSDPIRSGLGIDVSVLMGANVASQVRVLANRPTTARHSPCGCLMLDGCGAGCA